MDLYSLITAAKAAGASDLHLEPGLPPAMRVRGALKASGASVAGDVLLDAARELIGEKNWNQFLKRRSYDTSKNIEGTRCRINIMQTSRGVGMVVRLLMGFTATLDKLNLHPDIGNLVTHANGLVIISGPTGSGKSSTMAALIQEINLRESRHIVTIESPIEYLFKPNRAYIRQREVGRDTPSFEQALLDAMREDPDVLMVGEMRDPETMRLTLNTAETGHLVLATAHSATTAEALQRVVAAFPADIQNSVCAQLADCLVSVVCQRLTYRRDLGIQVPECEILMASTSAVKNFIRRGEFFKMMSCMETGADAGMWTYERYRSWLDAKRTWRNPIDESDEAVVGEMPELQKLKPVSQPGTMTRTPAPASTAQETTLPASSTENEDSRLEIEPEEGGLEAIIAKLKKES